jgi:hypothetical protein
MPSGCGDVQTEDRPVVKERVEMIKEHRPVEKEFVVSGCGAGHALLLPRRPCMKGPRSQSMSCKPNRPPLRAPPPPGGDARHRRGA